MITQVKVLEVAGKRRRPHETAVPGADVDSTVLDKHECLCQEHRRLSALDQITTFADKDNRNVDLKGC